MFHQVCIKCYFIYLEQSPLWSLSVTTSKSPSLTILASFIMLVSLIFFKELLAICELGFMPKSLPDP